VRRSENQLPGLTPAVQVQHPASRPHNLGTAGINHNLLPFPFLHQAACLPHTRFPFLFYFLRGISSSQRRSLFVILLLYFNGSCRRSTRPHKNQNPKHSRPRLEAFGADSPPPFINQPRSEPASRTLIDTRAVPTSTHTQERPNLVSPVPTIVSFDPI